MVRGFVPLWNACNRPYDCGKHTRQKARHPQDEAAAHCPLSPDMITRMPLREDASGVHPGPTETVLRRPTPHCDQPCNKQLPCGHSCPNPCHRTLFLLHAKHGSGSRCGRTSLRSACHQGVRSSTLVLSHLQAQLNCGRHECGEHCCSGRRRQRSERRQKRTANENFEAEHICLQVCGRQLKVRPAYLPTARRREAMRLAVQRLCA